jgi:hypothetical protein
MNNRLNANLRRRDLVRVLAAGVGAAATSARPLAAAATNSDPDKKQKARYQADSPEVQTFYRVNRYPAK